MKPDVEIIRHSPGRATVLLDGVPVPGVRAASYREEHGHAPTVTVELIANRVTVREEPRPLRRVGEYDG